MSGNGLEFRQLRDDVKNPGFLFGGRQVSSVAVLFQRLYEVDEGGDGRVAIVGCHQLDLVGAVTLYPLRCGATTNVRL